jgi:uncharacterized membrane protein
MRGQRAELTETRFRSIVKGFVWRGLASFATFILVWAFSHKPVMALEVSLLEVIIKLLLYYGHERTWNFITWGKIPCRMTSDEIRTTNQ